MSQPSANVDAVTFSEGMLPCYEQRDANCHCAEDDSFPAADRHRLCQIFQASGNGLPMDDLRLPKPNTPT